jgi:3-oxoacyl-[acyl-carrier protein] reductase
MGIATHPTPGSYPDLVGKVALVTGGSRGIGAATARAFARNGVRVVVSGRDAAAIDAQVAAITSSGGKAIGIAADCTDFRSIEGMRERTERELGPVDILVAFAGGGIAMPGPVQNYSEKEWHSTVDGNLTATFLTVKSFLPRMIERRGGNIVTMASTAARSPSPAPAPYAAAKAGIVMLTRQLAAEVGPQGIRVNCILPSAILTDRTASHMPEAQQRDLAASFPLRRLGVPDDVAYATLFLASDSSAWISGVTLDVTGGRVT